MTCSCPVFPEVLHRPGKDLFMKVPIKYGKVLTLDNVVKACQDAGLLPLCRNKREAGDCLIMDLPYEDTTMLRLIREVCPSAEHIDDISDLKPNHICPEIEGTFFYEFNTTNSNGVRTSIGVRVIDGEVKGYYFGTKSKSGEELKPYFAACGKVGGNVVTLQRMDYRRNKAISDGGVAPHHLLRFRLSHMV